MISWVLYFRSYFILAVAFGYKGCTLEVMGTSFMKTDLKV